MIYQVVYMKLLLGHIIGSQFVYRVICDINHVNCNSNYTPHDLLECWVQTKYNMILSKS